jgi:hypothetical protein
MSLCPSDFKPRAPIRQAFDVVAPEDRSIARVRRGEILLRLAGPTPRLGEAGHINGLAGHRDLAQLAPICR